MKPTVTSIPMQRGTKRLNASVRNRGKEPTSGFDEPEIQQALKSGVCLVYSTEARKNIEMVELARKEARTIVENDLDLEDFPELKTMVDAESYAIHCE